MAVGNGPIAIRIALPSIAALPVGQAVNGCAATCLGILPHLPYCPTYCANSIQVYALYTLYLYLSI
jgi:hypothetical protein